MSRTLLPLGRRVVGLLLVALGTGVLPAGSALPAAAAERPTSVSDPSDNGYTSPVEVLAVSAGWLHTCAIRAGDGSIACWGGNSSGQATPPAGPFTAVSADGDFACAIRAGDGSIACWGGNSSGQATPPAGSFTAVSTGGGFACAVRAGDGSIACWGGNSYGQATPPAGSFTAVSAGTRHGCGIRASDGSISCWGDNSFGVSTPPAGRFMAVSAGSQFTCGIRSDDAVICWGLGSDGLATPPTGSFTAVSGGDRHACAIHALDGSLACWGNNESGQATPPVGSFSDVSAGFNHTCAVRIADGHLVCWGIDHYGAVTAAPVPSLDPLPRWLAARHGTVGWTAAPAFVPVRSYDVRYRRAPWNGGFGEWQRLVTGTTATSGSSGGRPGTYCYSVRATDIAGGVSPWTAWPGGADSVHPPGTLTTCTTVPLDDRALTRSPGWTAGTGDAFYRGTFLRTSRQGATLRRTEVRGLSTALLATTCPTCGKVRVLSGSTAIRTISLYSPVRVDRVLIPIRTFAALHSRTLTIKVVSSGRKVIIDGLVVRRIP